YTGVFHIFHNSSDSLHKNLNTPSHQTHKLLTLIWHYLYNCRYYPYEQLLIKCGSSHLTVMKSNGLYLKILHAFDQTNQVGIKNFEQYNILNNKIFIIIFKKFC